MSQILWRIAVDTPAYQADDLSGKGAEATGGRRNAKGVPVVYASETRALTCLETLTHLNAGGLPLNRYLVAIEVPDATWENALRETAHTLAPGWDTTPAGAVSVDLGTAWLRAKTSALMITPSVIVPEKFNVLINPAHPDSDGVIARKVRAWNHDPRLTRHTPPPRR